MCRSARARYSCCRPRCLTRRSVRRAASASSSSGAAGPKNWTVFPGTARNAAIASISSASQCKNIETQLPGIFSRFYSSLRAAHLRIVRHRAARRRLVSRLSLTGLNAQSAHEQDARDPLAAFAGEFHHPEDPNGRRLVYLCGHSLGLQTKSTAEYIAQELADWQRLAVLGHHAAKRAVDQLPRARSGRAGRTGGRRGDRSRRHEFAHRESAPDDGQFFPAGRLSAIACSSKNRRSHPIGTRSSRNSSFTVSLPREHLIEVAPRAGERNLRTEDLLACLEREGPRLALVLLPGVQYLTGQALDLGPLIAAARRSGAGVGLDLAHAIGNVPLRLHDWDVDFAVWCSYKYLNAGPGADRRMFRSPAACAGAAICRALPDGGDTRQVDPLRDGAESSLPIAGAQGWQISNPPMLSTAPLLASLADLSACGHGSGCVRNRSPLQDSWSG